MDPFHPSYVEKVPNSQSFSNSREKMDHFDCAGFLSLVVFIFVYFDFLRQLRLQLFVAIS